MLDGGNPSNAYTCVPNACTRADGGSNICLDRGRSCAAPEVGACSGKSSGEACGPALNAPSWLPGGSGKCTANFVCADIDGGNRQALTCYYYGDGGGTVDASPEATWGGPFDNAGSDAGSDSIADAGFDASADASDANQSELDAGTSMSPGTHGGSCGCRVAGQSSGGPWRSATGLLLAACALFGARRTRSRQRRRHERRVLDGFAVDGGCVHHGPGATFARSALGPAREWWWSRIEQFDGSELQKACEDTQRFVAFQRAHVEDHLDSAVAVHERDEIARPWVERQPAQAVQRDTQTRDGEER
jgi:hypothetical protein